MDFNKIAKKFRFWLFKKLQNCMCRIWTVEIVCRYNCGLSLFFVHHFILQLQSIIHTDIFYHKIYIMRLCVCTRAVPHCYFDCPNNSERKKACSPGMYYKCTQDVVRLKIHHLTSSFTFDMTMLEMVT